MEEIIDEKKYQLMKQLLNKKDDYFSYEELRKILF